MTYEKMSRPALEQALKQEQARYERFCGLGLKLNMARGKPCREQLALSNELLRILSTPKDCFDGGVDARNYGELAGLDCARAYWADLLGCKKQEVFVGGSASLSLMYDTIAKAYTHGLLLSPRPWCREEKVKFLCPTPGYDRHFAITQSFGAELITVPMLPTGPDMDRVEALVRDPAVKGMWCVPKYSNPTGCIYSDETITRIAALRPAAPDFALMWDNAYCVHEFDGPFRPFPDILSLCREAGNPHMVYEFASTSKLTMPGAGMAAFACSEENLRYLLKLIGVQIISYDKVNQLRQVRFLKDKAHTLEIARAHGAILAPKFRLIQEKLETLAPLGIARWTQPVGGYFISLDVLPGTATRVWTLCSQAGVQLTKAGSAYPYGVDPKDENIRLAPSLPPLEELAQAADVLCCAVRLAALEKLLG